MESLPPASALLRVSATLLLLFNLADAVLTIIWTRVGLADEANPLFAQTLARSPVLFMVIKLALVSLGVLLLWRLRGREFARAAMVTTAAGYAVLIGYHLAHVDHLVARLA